MPSKPSLLGRVTGFVTDLLISIKTGIKSTGDVYGLAEEDVFSLPQERLVELSRQFGTILVYAKRLADLQAGDFQLRYNHKRLDWGPWVHTSLDLITYFPHFHSRDPTPDVWRQATMRLFSLEENSAVSIDETVRLMKKRGFKPAEGWRLILLAKILGYLSPAITTTFLVVPAGLSFLQTPVYLHCDSSGVWVLKYYGEQSKLQKTFLLGYKDDVEIGSQNTDS